MGYLKIFLILVGCFVLQTFCVSASLSNEVSDDDGYKLASALFSARGIVNSHMKRAKEIQSGEEREEVQRTYIGMLQGMEREYEELLNPVRGAYEEYETLRKNLLVLLFNRPGRRSKDKELLRQKASSIGNHYISCGRAKDVMSFLNKTWNLGSYPSQKETIVRKISVICTQAMPVGADVKYYDVNGDEYFNNDAPRFNDDTIRDRCPQVTGMLEGLHHNEDSDPINDDSFSLDYAELLLRSVGVPANERAAARNKAHSIFVDTLDNIFERSLSLQERALNSLIGSFFKDKDPVTVEYFIQYCLSRKARAYPNFLYDFDYEEFLTDVQAFTDSNVFADEFWVRSDKDNPKMRENVFSLFRQRHPEVFDDDDYGIDEEEEQPKDFVNDIVRRAANLNPELTRRILKAEIFPEEREVDMLNAVLEKLFGSEDAAAAGSTPVSTLTTAAAAAADSSGS